MASSQENPNSLLTESKMAELSPSQNKTPVRSADMDETQLGNISAVHPPIKTGVYQKQIPKGLQSAKVESKKEYQQLNGITSLDLCRPPKEDALKVGDNTGETKNTENKFYLALLAGDVSKIRKLLISKNVVQTIQKVLTNQNFNINYIFSGDHIKPRHVGATAVHVVCERRESKDECSSPYCLDDILNTLLDLGADATRSNIINGDSAIHVACKTGNVRAVGILLSRVPGCKDIQNYDGLTPLMQTISNFQIKFAQEYFDIVNALVEANCDVNLCSDIGTTALHVAVEKDLRLVEKLINAGANVNAVAENGVTPILGAVCMFQVGNGDRFRGNTNNPIETVKTLARCGADLSVLSHNGTPLLNIVLTKGDYEMVKILLKNGADPNATAEDGTTAIRLACELNNREMITTLLSFGADISLRTHDGFRRKNDTVLMFSILHDDLDMVDFLLRSGALNGRELVDRNNPLFYALKHGRISAAKCLLHFNFPVDYPDPIIPETVACKFQNTEILRVLILAGAKFEFKYLLRLAEMANDAEFKAFVFEYFRNARPLFSLCSIKLRQLLGLNFAKNLKTMADEQIIPKAFVQDVMLDYFLKPF